MPQRQDAFPEPPEPWQTVSVEHPGAVLIVPVAADGRVLLLRQHHFPVREWCWEVPASGIEATEDAAAAARELAWELGAVSHHLRPVAAFYPTSGTRCSGF